MASSLHPHRLRAASRAALIAVVLTALQGCASQGGTGPAGPSGAPGPSGPSGPSGPAGAVDQAQLDQLNGAIAAILPPGVVLPFAGDASKVPAGFLPCDGAEVSRTTYARLFAAIGIVHGGGDGVGTFNLPDYRGRFLRGVDGGAGRDPDAAARAAPQPGASSVGNSGDAVGSVQGFATGRPASPFTYLDNSGWGVCGTPSSIDCGGTAESGIRSDVVRSVATGGDAETRPVNASVLWIVRI